MASLPARSDSKTWEHLCSLVCCVASIISMSSLARSLPWPRPSGVDVLREAGLVKAGRDHQTARSLNLQIVMPSL